MSDNLGRFHRFRFEDAHAISSDPVLPLLRGQRVVGSNPTTPTTEFKSLEELLVPEVGLSGRKRGGFGTRAEVTLVDPSGVDVHVDVPRKSPSGVALVPYGGPSASTKCNIPYQLKWVSKQVPFPTS